MEDAVKAATLRAESFTLVAIAAGSALDDVHAAVEALVRTSGVRPIVVTLGDNPEPVLTHRDRTAVLEGLLPRYLNNAVAALRLSSLPAVAWWREPSTEGLAELGELVDRVVLDVENPSAVWAMVPQLSTRTAVSDLRWTRLTRWRDLFAQFFDMPEVRDRAGEFTRLEISAIDRASALLFAGWVVSRLPGGDRLEVSIAPDGTPVPTRSLQLTSEGITLSLRLLPSDACVETIVSLPGAAPASRVVAIGDQGLAALMGQELRVRTRDKSFEDAVAAAGGIQ